MRLAKLGTRFGGFILALFVIFGVTAMSAASAQAQWRDQRDSGWRRDRNWDRDQDYRRDRDYRNRRYDPYDRRNGNYGYNVYQVAVNQGYQAGLNTGASDGRRGQSYDPERSHYYRNPPSSNSYGYRGQYQQAFREGFLRGYAEGYRQYGYNRGRNYGRRFPW